MSLPIALVKTYWLLIGRMSAGQEPAAGLGTVLLLQPQPHLHPDQQAVRVEPLHLGSHEGANCMQTSTLHAPRSAVGSWLGLIPREQGYLRI